jgi:hypothetical protein
MKHLLLSTFLVSGSLYAGSLGLNINDEDVEVQATIDMSAAIGNGIDYLIQTSYLHTEEDDLFKIGFGASNTLQGADGLTLTLGLEGVFADDYAALPLFGQASLRLPFDSDIPATSLMTKIDYAPSVLSFRDGEKYLEYRFQADMEVIQNIHLFAGYRNIDTDYETHDYNLNDSWYGGLLWEF